MGANTKALTQGSNAQEPVHERSLSWDATPFQVHGTTTVCFSDLLSDTTPFSAAAVAATRIHVCLLMLFCSFRFAVRCPTRLRMAEEQLTIKQELTNANAPGSSWFLHHFITSSLTASPYVCGLTLSSPRTVPLIGAG